jgi:hypothetical protein
MTLRGSLAVFAVLGSLGLTSCTEHRPESSTVPDRLLVADRWEQRSGFLYVLAGPDQYSANISEVDMKDGRTRRLTSNPKGYGVSMFSASPAGIAMATAATGSDTLRVSTPSWTAGPSTLPASAPAIDSRGWVVASRGTGSGVAIDVYDPTGKVRKLFEAKDPDAPMATWGPGGSILIVGRSEPIPGAGPTWIRAVSRTGRTKRQPAALPGNFALLNNPYPDVQPFIAKKVTTGAGFVLDEALSHPVRVAAHWTPQCWTPDGRELLVTRGKKVGLWRTGEPDEVDAIASATSAIYGCAWLSEPSPGASSLD